MRAGAPSGSPAESASARGTATAGTVNSSAHQSFSQMLTGRADAVDTASTATHPQRSATAKPTPQTSARSATAAAGAAATRPAASQTTAIPKTTATSQAAPAQDTPTDAASQAEATTATATVAAAAAPAAAAAAAAAEIVASIANDAESPPPSPVDDADASTSQSAAPPGPSSAARRGSTTDASSAASQMAAQAFWLLAATAGTASSSPNATDADATTAGSDASSGATVGAHAATPGFNSSVTDLAATDLAALASADSASTNPAPDDAGVGSASGGGGNARAAIPGAGTDLTALASLARSADSIVQAGGAGRSIPVPVSDQAWPRAVAAQLQLMASSNVQSATLRLSPEHLGPLEVHIDMQALQINVNFVAVHADTRNALEQSVPLLRSMLAHGGLTLGQTQVQGEARSGSQSPQRGARNSGAEAAIEAPIVVSVKQTVGLVDEYA